ncbi:MAG: CPBP family intramembrane glutamic endopeptidase [Gemmataceae bacterium]
MDSPSRTGLEDWRAIHGGLILAAMPMPWLLPLPVVWPLYLLMPLLIYFLAVLAIARLRRSLCWLQLGSIDRTTILATLAIIALSSIALAGYDKVFHPDLGDLRARTPDWILERPILGGAFFALLNALLEEMIFRGILLDALESQVGIKAAVLVQALAFGLLHKEGYPPGPVGMGLATLYGLMLGWLRARSGGLLLPWTAHIVADATIFITVVYGR